MFANKLHAEAYELMLKKEYSAALELFNRSINEQATHPDLLADRAFCYLHLQKKDECLDDLTAAIKLQPAYAFRYSCRAFVKQLFGDSVGANADYTHALKLDPTERIAKHNHTIDGLNSVQQLINPENVRAQIMKTFIEFQKQFPSIEEQKKFLHFLKNGAKNK